MYRRVTDEEIRLIKIIAPYDAKQFRLNLLMIHHRKLLRH